MKLKVDSDPFAKTRVGHVRHVVNFNDPNENADSETDMRSDSSSRVWRCATVHSPHPIARRPAAPSMAGCCRAPPLVVSVHPPRAPRTGLRVPPRAVVAMMAKGESLATGAAGVESPAPQARRRMVALHGKGGDGPSFARYMAPLVEATAHEW
jgi:hypothetical protein